MREGSFSWKGWTIHWVFQWKPLTHMEYSNRPTERDWLLYTCLRFTWCRFTFEIFSSVKPAARERGDGPFVYRDYSQHRSLRYTSVRHLSQYRRPSDMKQSFFIWRQRYLVILKSQQATSPEDSFLTDFVLL